MSHLFLYRLTWVHRSFFSANLSADRYCRHHLSADYCYECGSPSIVKRDWCCSGFHSRQFSL